MKTLEITYDIDGKTHKGFMALPVAADTKTCPAMLIAPDWTGCNDFARNKAVWMTELGYIGFVIDMYGEGQLGTTNDEKMALIQPMLSDRNLLSRRVNAAFNVLCDRDEVNAQQVAAMGFCFGGMCVLDLARSGAAVSHVVSFHGLLGAPENTSLNTIHANILALHGHDDPMVSPEAVLAFQTEMSQAGANWEMHIYGQTKHAFTNPQANDETLGTVYNTKSEARALAALKSWLNTQEIK